MLCNGVEIKAGQFWEDGHGFREMVVYVNPKPCARGSVVTVDKDGDSYSYDANGWYGGYTSNSDSLTTYLPDCTGFDWVAPPVQQYRDLSPNELVEEGDEVDDGRGYFQSGNWHCRTARKAQASYFKYRRPINPPAKRTQPEYWLSPVLTDADNIAYIQRRPDADAKYEAVSTDGAVMFTLTHRSPDWTVLFEDEAKKRLKPVVSSSSDNVIRDCSLHINGVPVGYCTTPEISCPCDDDLDESDDDFDNRVMYVAAEDIQVGDLVVIENGYAYPVDEDEDEDDDEDVVDEYLYLVDGDVIEEGDEFEFCGEWFTRVLTGQEINKTFAKTRRKITGVFPRWYRTDDSYAYIKRDASGKCHTVTKDGLGALLSYFDWCSSWHDSLVEEGRWIPCTERAAKASIK